MKWEWYFKWFKSDIRIFNFIDWGSSEFNHKLSQFPVASEVMIVRRRPTKLLLPKLQCECLLRFVLFLDFTIPVFTQYHYVASGDNNFSLYFKRIE